MSKTKRIQMDVSEQSYDRLIKLKKETESSSQSDVLQKALRVYEYFIDAKMNGETLKYVKPDGTETKIEFM